MRDEASRAGALLGPEDPDPLEQLRPGGAAPVLLVCEHAGQCVPGALGDLGIARSGLDAHIGWDIGAGAVTRLASEALDAPAMLQRYSRLVIDCNRPPEAADSIPARSDGVAVPANTGLGAGARAARIREIFDPYHARIAGCLDSGRFRAAVSIHSFTPRLNGQARPWDIGLLYRHDRTTSEMLRAALLRRHPDLIIGMNQPYQVDDLSDWFVPRHCEPRGLPHSLIEIRNDHIETAEGQDHWARLLAHVLDRWLQEK